MIVTNPIENFGKKFDVVSLFIIVNGKILMLKRQSGKPQAEKWGPPAGKVGEGEKLKEAICRETFEETGIKITPDKIRKFNKTYYVSHGGTDFMFYVFSINVDIEPKVVLSPLEHSECQWFTPKDSLALNLVQDQEVPTADFFVNNAGKVL